MAETYLLIFKIITGVVGGVIGLLSAHFILYTIIGIFGKKRFPHTEEKLNYGVIISARNEEKVIGNLIKSIRSTDYPQDKLHIFVIAHNCTDKTAEVARNAGADVTVYEYNNPEERTKGYALKHLFECIERDRKINSVDGYFFFDADNILTDNYFSKMNDAFVANKRKNVIIGFRNTKNWNTNLMSSTYGVLLLQSCILNERGRTVCNCSSRIGGTGFVASAEHLKNGWNYVTLTEDWEFSANLLANGSKVLYCDDAMFYDEQPVSWKVMWKQRLRWSKGRILIFGQSGGKMFKNIFKKETPFRVSAYDMFVNVIPMLFTATIPVIVRFFILMLAPIFVPNFQSLWLSELTGFGVSLLSGYLLFVVYAIAVYIIARKRISKDVSLWRKISSVLFFPVFSFLNLILDLFALFQKVEWKPIPHVDTTSHQDLKTKQTKAKKSCVIEEDEKQTSNV